MAVNETTDAEVHELKKSRNHTKGKSSTAISNTIFCFRGFRYLHYKQLQKKLFMFFMLHHASIHCAIATETAQFVLSKYSVKRKEEKVIF